MLTPGVAALSTLSASAVTSGPIPSPPTTASLIVREPMPEPYWRARLAAGAPAAAASPPLSPRAPADWAARPEATRTAPEVALRAAAAVGGGPAGGPPPAHL